MCSNSLCCGDDCAAATSPPPAKKRETESEVAKPAPRDVSTIKRGNPFAQKREDCSFSGEGDAVMTYGPQVRIGPSNVNCPAGASDCSNEVELQYESVCTSRLKLLCPVSFLYANDRTLCRMPKCPDLFLPSLKHQLNQEKLLTRPPVGINNHWNVLKFGSKPLRGHQR